MLRRDYQMFILLEYKYNMLQLVLGICSIEVSEQNCIPMAIAVCLQENLQQKIRPGATPFSRTKKFIEIPGKQRCAVEEWLP